MRLKAVSIVLASVLLASADSALGDQASSAAATNPSLSTMVLQTGTELGRTLADEPSAFRFPNLFGALSKLLKP